MFLGDKSCDTIDINATLANNDTITSPGWPGRYENNLNCTTILTVELDERVKLVFSAFSVENWNYTNCQYDYVEIIDGLSSNKYCGTAIPPAMTSETNQLIIRFISDYSGTDIGFVATYQKVNRE